MAEGGNEQPSPPREPGEGESSDEGTLEKLRQYFAQKLGMTPTGGEEEDANAFSPTMQGKKSSLMQKVKDLFRLPQILEDVSLEGVAKYIKENKCKNIIVMAGAGISTSAGIPDFRSPGSGLYDNLQKYDLPDPQAIFEIGFFKQNPQPFYALAKEIFPETFKPTPCHYFIRLLSEKGMLMRHFTQNIDTLEHIAGIPSDKIVEAHGTFFTSHCLSTFCHKQYDLKWMKERVFNDVVPTCDICNGLVKPDIVFFGENLPSRFFECMKSDFGKCDALIVLGTSLVVQPFASLVDRVPRKSPRLLINREKAGERDQLSCLLGFGCGLDFDSPKNTRDVAWLGDCDDGCQALADALGFGEELKELVARDHARLDAEKAKNNDAEKAKKDGKEKTEVVEETKEEVKEHASL